TGDPKVLVWLHPNLVQFYVFRYVGEKPLPEGMSFSTDHFPAHTLKLIYPERAGATFGLELHHVFPLGNGRGFVRRTKFVQNQPPLMSGMHEVTDDTVFEKKDGTLIARILSAETEEREFGLDPGNRFLGKLDGIVFYWREEEKESIFGRETKSRKVLRWNVPWIADVEGVLRGNKGAYGVIAFRRFRVPRFTNATGDTVMVELSVDDAVILTPSPILQTGVLLNPRNRSRPAIYP